MGRGSGVTTGSGSTVGSGAGSPVGCGAGTSVGCGFGAGEVEDGWAEGAGCGSDESTESCTVSDCGGTVPLTGASGELVSTSSDASDSPDTRSTTTEALVRVPSAPCAVSVYVREACVHGYATV